MKQDEIQSHLAVLRDLVARSNDEQCDIALRSIECALEHARSGAIEEAASEIDCGCPQRAKVLETIQCEGPRAVYRHCPRGTQCAAVQAEEVRALKARAA